MSGRKDGCTVPCGMTFSIANIAALTNRLAVLSAELQEQVEGRTISVREHYFGGVIRRTHTLLTDCEIILRSHNAFTISSAFILYRCLLDDYLTMAYLQTRNFSDEDVIALSAEAYEQKFRKLKVAAEINKTYFDNEHPELNTLERHQASVDSFASYAESQVYFQDAGTQKFKVPEKPLRHILDIEKSPVAKDHAKAFVMRELLSEYVNYSAVTEQLENHLLSREAEIDQLRNVLIHVYQTLLLCSQALNRCGIRNELNGYEVLQELKGEER